MHGPQASVAALLTLALALGSGVTEAVDQPSASVVGHCIGDCGDDGRVTIDELILGVRIALGDAASDVCGVGGPGPGFGIDGLVTSVLNSLAGCTTLENLSAFEQFAYALTPAYGFCPPLGAVHDAVIARRGDIYLLERSIVDTGTPGVDDCLPEYLTGRPCLIARRVPCRALTADEIQRMHKVFAQITVWTAADSFCLFGVDDPCLVRAARWDSLQTSDAICTGPRLDYEQSERVAALVESLGDGPERACDGQ
jgi:hypothetical protein